MIPLRMTIFVVAVLWLATAALEVRADVSESPDEIMKKSFQVTRFSDSTSQLNMTLITESGETRERKTLNVTKLAPGTSDNMRMLRFISPPDIAGTATLLLEHSNKDDDLWIYLPALKKVRRLVSSNKKDSFFGTDFSYEDIIGYHVAEWKYTRKPDAKIDGEDCFVIEAIPINDKVKSDTGFSRRTLWVNKSNFVLMAVEGYDLGGKPLKTCSFREIKLVDARGRKWQPMKIEAKNVQSGHRTVITFLNFKANTGVKNDFFTQRYLEKESP